MGPFSNPGYTHLGILILESPPGIISQGVLGFEKGHSDNDKYKKGFVCVDVYTKWQKGSDCPDRLSRLHIFPVYIYM